MIKNPRLTNNMNMFFSAIVLSVLVVTKTAMGVAITYTHLLEARFSMDGIRGAVMFQQRTIDDIVDVKLQFDKFEERGDWGVFQHPSIYMKDATDSCLPAIVGSLIPSGNLTEARELFVYKATFFNLHLKVVGMNSILGASLVLFHKGQQPTPWACATILPFNTTVIYATATFKGVVAGQINFMQDSTNNKADVAIIGSLYYTDGRTTPSDNNGWYISSSSASNSNNCGQLTTILTGRIIEGVCSVQEPTACVMGDLSAKLRKISIGIANDPSSDKKFRKIDISLNVASIIGHALVIRDAAGVPFACANIVKNGPLSMSATFNAAVHEGVSGSVSFSQQSPYHPTVIQNALDGLASKGKGYHVHKFSIPTPQPRFPCSSKHVGGHLNPYKINKGASYPADGSGATMDKYEVGDISGKFGNLAGKTNNTAKYVDTQMALYGSSNNILDRALVIHKNDALSTRWVCSNIVPDNILKSLSATANFTTTLDLEGYVKLRQYLLADGTMSSTSINVDVYYKSMLKLTTFHNWHIHMNQVGSDRNDPQSTKCQSVGAHYNPYSVNTAGKYSIECSPQTPLRCELGDLSGKHGTYDIGDSMQYYIDINTPLFGPTTVLGRSITFHTEFRGAPRFACADIIPDSSAAVTRVEHSYPEAVPFDKARFSQLVVSGLGIKSWQIKNITTMDITTMEPNSRNTTQQSKKPCKKVTFLIIDILASPTESYKTKFQDMAESKLGVYKTCPPRTTGKSWKMNPSCMTVLVSMLVFFILAWK